MAPLKKWKQRVTGRTPLRFQVEVTPFSVGDVPPQVKRASLAWQRGAKLQYTHTAEVVSEMRQVYWGKPLKQTATLYKDGNKFQPKEYTFLAQSVLKGGGNTEKTVVFGKAKVDLAQYCHELFGQPADVTVKLKPHGTLSLRISATWLKNCQPENDAMTEISALSLNRSDASNDDQDLSGFDNSKLKAFHGSPAVGALGLPQRAYSASGGVRGMQRPILEGVSDEGGSMSTPGRGVQHGSRSMPAHHQRSSSDSLARPGQAPIAEHRPLSPIVSPTSEDYTKIVKESYATLLDSDDEDGQGGVAGSGGSVIDVAKRWWGRSGSMYEREGVEEGEVAAARSGSLSPTRGSDDVAAIDAETDIEALRYRARALVAERDAALLEAQQADRRNQGLENECESLGLTKQMLTQHLSAAEERLAELCKDDVFSQLVEAKLRLAQADFEVMELQGQVSAEQSKARTLMSRLTNLETQHHELLNNINNAPHPDSPHGKPPASAWRRATSWTTAQG